mmetsp:Transcript_114174/g.285624  ORF Transcript_114174/g.285624 Transcript_114174/m.285624 type:complete len:255 (+) Transcript_114174:281-1045(+)
MLHGHRCLRREGLVDLEDVDVSDLQARLLEGGRDRISGTDAHELGVHAHHGEAPHPREHREAHRRGRAAPREEHQRGAIGDLARVARVRGAVRLEGGLQLGEALERRARPRPLVGGDGHRRDLALLVLHLRSHRHDLGVEEALLLRREGLGVGVDGHLVLLLTRDLVGLSDVFGRDAHRHQAGRSQVIVADLRAELLHIHTGRHVVHRHGLHAAREAHVDDARADARCDVRHGLQPAAALAVHRRYGHVVGQVS